MRNFEIGSSKMHRAAGTSLQLFFLRMGGAFAALISNLLLAKFVPDGQLGVMLTMMSMATLASILPFLCLDAAIIRFLRQYVAQNDFDSLRAYLRFLLRINKIIVYGIAIVVFSLSIYTLIHEKYLPLWAWSPLILASILFSWMRFRSQISNADGEVVYSTIGRSFARPIIFLVGITVFILLDHPISSFWISLVFLASVLSACILQHMLISPLPAIAGPSIAYKPEWVSGGLSLGVNMVFQEYLVEILIIIVALTLPSEDVAVYAIALRLVAFARFSVIAVDMSFRPIIAKNLASQNITKVARKLKASAKIRLYFALIAIIGLFIGTEIFQHFLGGIFINVSALLPILLLDVIVLALLGSPHFLLGQTQHAPCLIPATIGSTILLAIGVYWGGKFGGLTGAAWLSSLILSFRLIYLFMLTYRRIHFNSSLIPMPKIWRLNNVT